MVNYCSNLPLKLLEHKLSILFVENLTKRLFYNFWILLRNNPNLNALIERIITNGYHELLSLEWILARIRPIGLCQYIDSLALLRWLGVQNWLKSHHLLIGMDIILRIILLDFNRIFCTMFTFLRHRILFLSSRFISKGSETLHWS